MKFWAFARKDTEGYPENYLAWILTKRKAKQLFSSRIEAMTFFNEMDIENMAVDSKEDFLEDYECKEFYMDNEELLGFLEVVYAHLPILKHPGFTAV